ncbi:hypothetical protein KIPB_015425, partial [Kipferlia bialata]
SGSKADEPSVTQGNSDQGSRPDTAEQADSTPTRHSGTPTGIRVTASGRYHVSKAPMLCVTVLALWVMLVLFTWGLLSLGLSCATVWDQMSVSHVGPVTGVARGGMLIPLSDETNGSDIDVYADPLGTSGDIHYSASPFMAVLMVDEHVLLPGLLEYSGCLPSESMHTSPVGRSLPCLRLLDTSCVATGAAEGTTTVSGVITPA